MGYSNFLSVGDRIAIKDSDEAYASKILKFKKSGKNGESIVVLAPMKGKKTVDINDGEKKYVVIFYTSAGLYRGICKIIDSYTEDDVVEVLELAVVSELERHQRREYFRIDYIDMVEFKILSYIDKSDGSLCEKKDSWHIGTLTNISGGGLRFNSSEGMEDAKKIKVKFRLKDFKNIGNKDNEASEEIEFKIECDVVGVKIRNHKGIKFDYRLRFTDISKSDRESIVRFVFERERWMRKKALGKI